MTVAVPTRITKRIAGKCLYSGCADEALDGSDYCAPHDAHERGRAATRQLRRRQKLANAGLCISGCGRKIPKRRRPDGTAVCRRCKDCRKAHAARERERTCVTGEPDGVTGTPSETEGNWRVDPGTDWMRYRGKGRRGRLTRDEQAAEDKRDARWAIAEIEKFITAVDVVMSDAVQELPRIQREAARREAAQFLGTAGRFLDELAEKWGMIDRPA